MLYFICIIYNWLWWARWWNNNNYNSWNNDSKEKKNTLTTTITITITSLATFIYIMSPCWQLNMRVNHFMIIWILKIVDRLNFIQNGNITTIVLYFQWIWIPNNSFLIRFIAHKCHWRGCKCFLAVGCWCSMHISITKKHYLVHVNRWNSTVSFDQRIYSTLKINSSKPYVKLFYDRFFTFILIFSAVWSLLINQFHLLLNFFWVLLSHIQLCWSNVFCSIQMQFSSNSIVHQSKWGQ